MRSSSLHSLLFIILLFIAAYSYGADPVPALHNGRFRPVELVDTTAPNLLPRRDQPGEWAPLALLEEQSTNFTLYSDETFALIWEAYLAQDLENTYHHLATAYKTLAGKPYAKATGKTLHYPSQKQLKAELFYYTYPLTEITILFYTLAILFFTLHYTTKKRTLPLALTSTTIAFLLHTLILALRCYILQRPPVSNMLETVIYVPWIGVLTAFILRFPLKSHLALPPACIGAFTLLIFQKATHMDESMENVQAVLDSQYWLTVHVLMVVGSYGIFLLASLIGHLFLIEKMRHPKQSPLATNLSQYLLQTLYLGTALLIIGTVLGGVWAAQSWGRFWDWDPKESWAFISSCVYLIWIHLHRFRVIGNTGLAVGAICGFLAISFTWYGVNYLLGTGLHSYGFGNGGEIYYYTFLFAEVLFVIYFLKTKRKAFDTNS